MLNWIFGFLVVASVLTAALNGTMPLVTAASLASAKTAVELAIGLIGQMALWLGLMGVLEAAGVTTLLARLLRPVMVWLFPDVPASHPAMGAMVMSIAANILGLDNAATPFGLKAMYALQKLEVKKGVATNAMALFLAINTSGIAVIPMRAIAVRATLGSKDPAGILLPSMVSSFLSTLAAIALCKLLERLPVFSSARLSPEPAAAVVQVPEDAQTGAQISPQRTRVKSALLLVAWSSIAAVFSFALYRASAANTLPLSGFFRSLFAGWAIPTVILAIVTVGLSQRINVYDVFVTSAKEGFQTAVTVIPYLVAILVPVGMLRASGGLDQAIHFLKPLTDVISFPAEALPMALIRPLSGSGALAVMTETMKTAGPDSLVGYLVCLIGGSSETTFYVLAVYFGAIQTKVTRHTLAACLTADAVGLLIALWTTYFFFGQAA